MAAHILGRAPCPLCKRPARVSMMKNGRACLTCEAAGCKCQLMTRSDDADESLRGQIVPEAAPAPADAPAARQAPKKPEPMPTPGEGSKNAPAAPPAARAVAAPAPAEVKRKGWGLLG